MTIYNETHLEQLKAQSWDLTTADEWARANGFSTRSVVAKIGAIGAKYTPKGEMAQPARKPAKPSKATVQAEIEQKLGKSIPTLNKMNLDDLVQLASSL
jgi:hypothetical protein